MKTEDDVKAIAFDDGYDSYPINKNPYDPRSTLWVHCELGFETAKYYADEESKS